MEANKELAAAAATELDNSARTAPPSTSCVSEENSKPTCQAVAIEMRTTNAAAEQVDNGGISSPLSTYNATKRAAPMSGSSRPSPDENCESEAVPKSLLSETLVRSGLGHALPTSSPPMSRSNSRPETNNDEILSVEAVTAPRRCRNAFVATSTPQKDVEDPPAPRAPSFQEGSTAAVPSSSDGDMDKDSLRKRVEDEADDAVVGCVSSTASKAADALAEFPPISKSPTSWKPGQDLVDDEDECRTQAMSSISGIFAVRSVRVCRRWRTS